MSEYDFVKCPACGSMVSQVWDKKKRCYRNIPSGKVFNDALCAENAKLLAFVEHIAKGNYNIKCHSGNECYTHVSESVKTAANELLASLKGGAA